MKNSDIFPEIKKGNSNLRGRIMKTIILCLVLSLVSLSVFAKEREFRVNKNIPTANGYAIAWGIPGVLVDFEKIDEMTSEEFAASYNVESFKNFLVDLERNTIVHTLDLKDFPAALTLSADKYSYGSYLALKSINLNDNNSNYEVLVTSALQRWHTEELEFIILKNGKVEQILKASDVIRGVERQLKKRIGIEAHGYIELGARVVILGNTVSVDGQGLLNAIKLTYHFPYSDESTLILDTLVKFEYKNGKLLTKLVSFTTEHISDEN